MPTFFFRWFVCLCLKYLKFPYRSSIYYESIITFLLIHVLYIMSKQFQPSLWVLLLIIKAQNIMICNRTLDAIRLHTGGIPCSATVESCCKSVTAVTTLHERYEISNWYTKYVATLIFTLHYSIRSFTSNAIRYSNAMQ